MAQINCESCTNYEYDEEYDCYVCTKDLDEDEMIRFIQGTDRKKADLNGGPYDCKNKPPAGAADR